MSNNFDGITAKQLDALVFVSILSPMIRLFPKSAVSLGGFVTWLSPLFALPASIPMVFAINRLMQKQKAGTNLSDAIKCTLGEAPGKFVLLVTGIWLTVYLGVILRSSAGRLTANIYPNGNIWMFAGTIIAVSAIMALGKKKSLGRMAEIYMPLAVVVIAAVLLMSLGDFKAENILPVTLSDADDIMLGALPMLNVVTANVYFMFLLDKKDGERACRFRRVVYAVVLLTAIMTLTVGTLSAGIIEKTQHPFFIMIRNLDMLGMIERIEAVVIVLWVITDVVYFASILKTIATVLEASVKIKKKTSILAAAVSGGIISVFCIRSSFVLEKISEKAVPIINMGIIGLILILPLIIGLFRKKI